MTFFLDVEDPRMWDDLENRAVEDAWAQVELDWPDNIPDNVQWYADMITHRFLFEESQVSLPRWVYTDTTFRTARFMYARIQHRYYAVVYENLKQAISSKEFASGRLVHPTTPPLYQPRDTIPLGDAADDDDDTLDSGHVATRR